MNSCGAFIRSLDKARTGIEEAVEMLERLEEETGISDVRELPDAFRNYDLLLAQYVYLNAIAGYISEHGRSRGSYLIHDSEGELPHDNLPGTFRFSLDDGTMSDRIQVVSYEDGTCTCEWEPVRPIPEEKSWFENVWNDFLKGRVIQ